MADATKSPTCWTRPNDVMRKSKLKQRQKALQARMDAKPRENAVQFLQDSGSGSQDDIGCSALNEASKGNKRANPFKQDLCKKFRRFDFDTPSCDFDASNDNTIFQFLNQSSSSNAAANSSVVNSFSNFLEKISDAQQPEKEDEMRNLKSLPLDWSVKSRVRFFSKKPFQWAKTLKTLEEASGTTGFCRCLNLRSEDCGTSPSFDTGINAQFHQCCLVWQHPTLPWLSLFPRSGPGAASKGGTFPMDATVKESLHKAWRESFRSLLQLLRSHQCAYFYVCANKFTCLFRAAGIGGFAEIHALISPTTSGFRGMLDKDDVVFSMPLRKEVSKVVPGTSSSPPDPGYETQDSLACSPDEGPEVEESEVEEGKDEEEEEEGAAEWLQSMGVAAAQIKKMSASQGKISSAKAAASYHLDQRPNSLVVVEKDEEVQALFNLLLNCQSIIATSGPLAGMPPTLLAPVAFLGATMRTLTTNQRVVTLSGEQFQCIEISGPILPHTLREISSLLEPSQGQFSAICSSVDHSRTFSQLPCPQLAPAANIFSRENLRDCGLRPATLHALCQPGPCQILESFKYSDGAYMCQE